MFLKNGWRKIITKYPYSHKLTCRQTLSNMYNVINMDNKCTQPTLEDLGDANDLILGATGSNVKDDNLDDGFTREGISIGQS